MATGVIGLGNIGGHIAANLVADGNDVVVHDVDADAMAALNGATAAPDVATVGQLADVTLLSLPTPNVVVAVAAAWADAASPGSILVDLSTNSPALVRELGHRLAASGHHLVEAPLTGGSIGAEKRMLVFMGAAMTSRLPECCRCSGRSAGPPTTSANSAWATP